MTKAYTVTATAVIKADAEIVYAIIADYHDGHPRILPKQYFKSLEVEQGGVGAGTIIRCQMRVAGQTHTFRAAITEPEPWHVLKETSFDGDGTVTTFTVAPISETRDARVTIKTTLQSRTGVAGLLTRFTTRLLLRRIYAQELELLAAFAERRARAARKRRYPRLTGRAVAHRS